MADFMRDASVVDISENPTERIIAIIALTALRLFAISSTVSSQVGELGQFYSN